jgi:hypothetical protein
VLWTLCGLCVETRKEQWAKYRRWGWSCSLHCIILVIADC